MNGRSVEARPASVVAGGDALRRAASGSTVAGTTGDDSALGARSQTAEIPMSAMAPETMAMRASRRLDAATAAGSTTATRVRHFGHRSRLVLKRVPHAAQI